MVPKPIEVEVPFDDERHDLQYLLRVVFTPDPGDVPHANGVRIERLRVVEVRRLGDDGEVVSVDTAPDVRRFESRVWELFEEDPVCRATLEDECRSRPPVRAPQPVDSGWMRRTPRANPSEHRGAG